MMLFCGRIFFHSMTSSVSMNFFVLLKKFRVSENPFVEKGDFFFCICFGKVRLTVIRLTCFSTQNVEKIYLLAEKWENILCFISWTYVWVYVLISLAIHLIIILLLLLLSHHLKEVCCNLEYKEYMEGQRERLRQSEWMSANRTRPQDTFIYLLVHVSFPWSHTVACVKFKCLYPYLGHDHRVYMTHYICVKEEKWFIISHSNTDTLTPKTENHSKICCSTFSSVIICLILWGGEKKLKQFTLNRIAWMIFLVFITI